MIMRKLFFTTGSPFARAVRIILAEKGLNFEREETFTTPSVEERAKVTPTLQVPTLVDGDLRWLSTVGGVCATGG
jgi:glutathione S-transferase